MKINTYKFKKAQPVWEVGTQFQKNRNLAFVTDIAGKKNLKLAIAGSTAFEILINDKLIAFGPARAAHGYYRVDEYALAPYLSDGNNRLVIRIAGYNINCFEYLNQPSFLCAELVSGCRTVAYTGAPCVNFDVYAIDERIMKVQKYSFQRAFVESYRFAPGAYDFTGREKLTVEAVGQKNFICRDMPYGDYDRLFPICVEGGGSVSYSEKENYYAAREVVNICEQQLGYTQDELEFSSHVEVGKMDFSEFAAEKACPKDIKLGADTYKDIDMGKNHTGLFEFDFEALGDGQLYVIFDEAKFNGQLKCFRLGCSQIVAIDFKAGKYHFVSAEPYVLRNARIIAKGAAVEVKDFKLIEIAFPKSAITAEFESDDADMRKVYDAAVETFRANTVDIYMDCPSRERAGWLCDSFFTSRVERVLTGRSDVERAFLQNFLLPKSFECIPEGMLPMCYPSDHYDGVFIPNWAMWYGVELGEYFDRTGDRELIDSAKDKMYGLYNYFKGFENEFGLLEGLKSWVFIEWSKSNELVQDVSFASNMLYAKFLDSLAGLYGDAELSAKSIALKKVINDMAMTESKFYCDNANRVDGKLVLSGERTESCQYYAFFCGVATPEQNPWLWNTLVNDFGYDRAKTGKFPEIYPANAFIGNYLRLDLLNNFGFRDALYDNIKGYFTYMADRTGTLWENVGDYASCNHGFASHVIYWMKSIGIVQ